MDCLQKKGYAATTARDLVDVSGTNLASIGYHFGSKEALLNEAIARDMARWTAAIERDVFAEAPATVEQFLERALAAMIDRFDDIEPHLVSFVEMFPPAVRSAELRGNLAAAYEQARVAGRRMFERAAAESDAELEPHDATVLASLMLAVCDGLILQFLLDPEAVPGSDEIVDALAATRRRW